MADITSPTYEAEATLDAMLAEGTERVRLGPRWLVDVLGNQWRPLDTWRTAHEPRKYVRTDTEDWGTPMVATALEVTEAYGYSRFIDAPGGPVEA